MAKDNSMGNLRLLLFSLHSSNSMLVSFLPLLLTYRGLSGQEIGWVLAVGPAISIFAQPFWGYLSDKYQTVKKILIATSFGVVVSSLVFFQMKALLIIMSCAIFFYFFQSAMAPLVDSLSQRRADQLGVHFGSIRTWGSIGFATSALLVGWLLDLIGIQYLVVPYLLAISVVIFASFHQVDIKVEQKPIQISDLQKLIKNPPLLFYLTVLFVIAITHRANDSFVGLYINELGGQDNLVGIAWFVGVVSEGFVYAFAGKWFKRYHPLIFITVAGFIFTVRWFLYGYITIPFVIVILQFLHGFSFGIFYIASFHYVTRLIPIELRSSGHLLYASIVFGLSGIIGSLGGGFLFENYGGQILYTAMGILALLGSCFVFLYHTISYRKRMTLN